MVNTKGRYLAVLFVVAVIVGGAVLYSMGLVGGTFGGTEQPSVSGTTDAAKAARVSEPAGGVAIPRWDVEFNAIAGDSAAQDADADIDIDIFEWSDAKDKKAQSLDYVDCSDAVPAVFNGNDLTTTVTQKNFCEINMYKFWRDSSWTGGNSENVLSNAYNKAVAADLDDVDGSGTLSASNLKADKTYLVTFLEAATTDDEDIMPVAFLIGSTKTANPALGIDHFADGTINTRFEVGHYSDARAHSKLRVFGECKDDTTNADVTPLNSNLDGAVHSSITTADTIKLDCDIFVEVTADGYGLALLNPLAASNSEKAYTVFTPYGENGSTGAWMKYGVGEFTGDVPYSTANVASDQILEQGSFACGHTITNDNTVNAIVEASQNIYEDCYKESSHKVNGAMGVFDKGDKVHMFVTISEVKVDYDLAAAADDETVSGAGGGTGEDLMEVIGLSLESSVPFINANLTA